jgi:hypothetical protein
MTQESGAAAPKARPQRRRLRDYDPDTFYGRIRVAVLMTAFTGFFVKFAHPYVSVRNPLLGHIMLVVLFLSPVLGVLLHDVMARFTGKMTKGFFFPEKAETAPAHSVGEALLQREAYLEAADWFTARVLADPADWRAQAWLVDILAGHLDDPEREAEERTRLLKHPGIPEGAWVETALDQGRFWEVQGNPERAVNAYKTLLWRVAEGPDAEEAKRRLKELERPPAAT